MPSEFMQRLQAAGRKASIQANAFGQQATREFQRHQNGFQLEPECTKASKILQAFLADPEHPESALNAIPKAVLVNARGLAIFTVVKAGLVWSARAGSGVVIARLPDGTWSAPSCIATGGIGFGLQIGADLSEFVVVLNTEEAVKSFSAGGNVTIGGQLSAAAGPIGTGAAINAALLHPAPLFTYSKSKGLFAGISLEGTALVERKDANRDFYGAQIPAADLLAGKVPPPEAASPLYTVVEAAEAIDEAGLPQAAYIPQAPNAPQPAEKPIFESDQH